MNAVQLSELIDVYMSFKIYITHSADFSFYYYYYFILYNNYNFFPVYGISCLCMSDVYTVSRSITAVN